MTLSVVVIGGGIMGSAVALSLARRGDNVTVLERAVPGAEASSAAAGILGAQVEAQGPGLATDMLLQSRALYEPWAAELSRTTGIDVGFRPCGVLHVEETDAFFANTDWQTECGLTTERLGAEALRELEPQLSPQLQHGVRFAGDAQVEPQKLFRAVQIAATQRGVVYRTGTQVRRVVVEHGRATGVALEDGSFVAADVVVLAAGSWSSLVDGVDLPRDAVQPARGQIVELSLRMPPLRQIIVGRGAYLVPREDGRVLLGSTLEFVGYTKEVTALGVRELLTAATRICPLLEQATFTGAWSSFRPFAKEGRVLVGRASIEGLVHATGHHRNGILLAPVTAEIVAAACHGETYVVPNITRGARAG